MGSLVGTGAVSSTVVLNRKPQQASVKLYEWYNATGSLYSQESLAVMDITALQKAVSSMLDLKRELEKNKSDNKAEIELIKIRIKYAEDLIKAKKKGDKAAETEAGDKANRDRDKLYSEVDKPSFWDKLFGAEDVASAASEAATVTMAIPSVTPVGSETEKKGNGKLLLYIGIPAGIILLGGLVLLAYRAGKKNNSK